MLKKAEWNVEALIDEIRQLNDKITYAKVFNRGDQDELKRLKTQCDKQKESLDKHFFTAWHSRTRHRHDLVLKVFPESLYKEFCNQKDATSDEKAQLELLYSTAKKLLLKLHFGDYIFMVTARQYKHLGVNHCREFVSSIDNLQELQQKLPEEDRQFDSCRGNELRLLLEELNVLPQDNALRRILEDMVGFVASFPENNHKIKLARAMIPFNPDKMKEATEVRFPACFIPA